MMLVSELRLREDEVVGFDSFGREISASSLGVASVGSEIRSFPSPDEPSRTAS